MGGDSGSGLHEPALPPPPPLPSPPSSPTLKNNSGGKGWIVQKFGGTSVGKFADKIATDIVSVYLEHQNKVVVVCSAQSTGKKATGTTSRLLDVFYKLQGIAEAAADEEAQKALLDDAKRTVELICSDHIAGAAAFIQDARALEAAKADIKDECRMLDEYLEVAKRFNLEINSRAKDRVVSFGEKLSCRLMTHLLRARGVDAEYVDLTDVLVNDGTGRLEHAYFTRAAGLMGAKTEACGDRVPVVTGFFGNVAGGLLDGRVGRGYTDLCAALLAVAMHAEELQVWKEVDGIFTADPTKVPTACLVPSITPSEAAELTFYGSEVIHHLTMDQVIKATPPIPVRIKNVKNPRGEGTVVRADPALARGHQLQRSDRPSDPDGGVRRKPKRPTAVTIKDRISIINIHSNKRSISHGFFARVFSIMDQHRVSVDLISTSEVHVSMAVHVARAGGNRPRFDAAVGDLAECGAVSVLHDMAILSLVGADMKNMVGVAGKMFSCLGDHGVNLEMISQGASEINISCVIDAKHAERAMNIIHTNLFTFLG